MKIIDIIHADAGPVHKKYHVTLTEEERTALHKLVSTGRVAARKRKHAEILLAADASAGGPAMVDADIRAKYDVGLAAIARVRQRFVEEGLEAALAPRPHLNLHARKVDGDAEAHLIALACSPPPEGEEMDLTPLGGRVRAGRQWIRHLVRNRTPGVGEKMS